MDEQYLVTTARYIELNPVRAGMVQRPEEYQWSSARAHLEGEDDVLARAEPLLAMVPDWREFLASGLDEEEISLLRRHERTGRPLGNETFIARLEQQTGRVLRRKKPGPKKGS